MHNDLLAPYTEQLHSEFAQYQEELHHGPFDAAVFQDVGQLSMKAFTAMHAKIRKTDVAAS